MLKIFVDVQGTSARTLKFQLTDGATTVVALEWRPLISIKQVPESGSKLLCRDVPVHLSHLLLTNTNTLLIGGGIPTEQVFPETSHGGSLV